jgi:hypothetical protein
MRVIPGGDVQARLSGREDEGEAEVNMAEG